MIEKDMLVSELLEAYEAAGEVLAGAGMACIGCASASGATLEQAALEHGLEILTGAAGNCADNIPAIDDLPVYPV